MQTRIPRRDFLKATSAAAGALASGVQPARSKVVTISSASYPQAGDYPIQAKPFSQVTIVDRFWQPRIATNATVTIPLLAARQGQSAGRGLKDFPRRVRAIRAF